MDRFPSEFDDLLNRRGRQLLRELPPLETLLRQKRTPIVLLENVMDAGVARACVRLLDDALYPHLRAMNVPIPREALTAMKTNYQEELPKTTRVKTAMLGDGRSKALRAAQECGLTALMRSKSFLSVAQRATKSSLESETWGRQVICYETGGYSGPHNDHHPENEILRNGFLDLHVMFSNDDVASQSLVYEEKRFLSSIHNVATRAAIAIYRLPFWHYTTPLVARRGREATARRWLLLGSFDYNPPLTRLEY